jgi:hypothetical protein
MPSGVEEEIQHISDLVNFVVYLRGLIVNEGFTELWFRDPTTGEKKRTLIFYLN